MAVVYVRDQEGILIRPAAIDSLRLATTDGRRCVLADLKPSSKHQSPAVLAEPNKGQPDLPNGYDEALHRAIEHYVNDPVAVVVLESEYDPENQLWKWDPMRLVPLKEEH